MMSYKQYCMSFIENTNIHFGNGWGLFVDIETGEDILQHKYNYYKPSNYVSIPETIKEKPSIRSMASMTSNLNDMSMIFDMDEDFEPKTNNMSQLLYTNIFGIIVLAVICYSLY